MLPPQNIHFVFLQGMPCALFRRVGSYLRARGARVTRINFCVGDYLFWSGKDCLSYRDGLAAWPAFIEAFFRVNRVSDLVLLGEQRDYHKEAVAIALRMGIRVSVTDFGYLRPDWITLERDGMGGNSHFPKAPDEIRARAANGPEPDFHPRFSESAWGMASRDLIYNFANLLLGGLFPRYQRSDRRPPTLSYTYHSAMFLLRARLRRRQNQKVVADLLARKADYFVFPLQLEHDFQILAYSGFPDMRSAIEYVVRSFAQFAPPHAELLIKAHPWDAGIRNWSRIVVAVAETYRVGQRVRYLDGGNLDQLSTHAQGMVTVNSTSGLKAMMLGCPVKVLGQAIFDVETLSYQGTLDDFWQHAAKPEPLLLADFLRLLANEFQIRGVFFNEAGLASAVAQMGQRLWQQALDAPSRREHSEGSALNGL